MYKKKVRSITVLYLRARMFRQVFDVELVFFILFKRQFVDTLGQHPHVPVMAILHGQVTVDSLLKQKHLIDKYENTGKFAHKTYDFVLTKNYFHDMGIAKGSERPT